MTEKHSAPPTSYDAFFHGLGQIQRFPKPRPNGRCQLRKRSVAADDRRRGALESGSKWAYWLKTTIPDAREVIELPAAKLWFPEEYPEFVSEKLRVHWTRVTLEADALSITGIGPPSSDGAR